MSLFPSLHSHSSPIAFPFQPSTLWFYGMHLNNLVTRTDSFCISLIYSLLHSFCSSFLSPIYFILLYLNLSFSLPQWYQEPSCHITFILFSLYTFQNISLSMSLFRMYPTFLLSTPVSFSHSPTSLHHVSPTSSFFLLFLTPFLNPPPPHDSFTGCGMRCVISERHVSHRATHPEESGCVERVWWGGMRGGRETGSRGLEEVKRRGRDRWGRADKHERSNKRGDCLRKENKRRLSGVQERRGWGDEKERWKI